MQEDNDVKSKSFLTLETNLKVTQINFDIIEQNIMCVGVLTLCCNIS